VLENVNFARTLLVRLWLLTTIHQSFSPLFLIGFQHHVKLMLTFYALIAFTHYCFRYRFVNSATLLKSFVVFLCEFQDVILRFLLKRCHYHFTLESLTLIGVSKQLLRNSGFLLVLHRFKHFDNQRLLTFF